MSRDSRASRVVARSSPICRHCRHLRATHTVRRIRVTDPWCASIRTEVQEGIGDVQIIPCACPGFESAPDEPERG